MTAQAERVIEITIPELHSGQKAIRAEAKRFNVLECGRRFGKTVMGEVLAAETSIDNAQPVGWFAPTNKILADAWREIGAQLGPIVAKKSEQEKRLELITGGCIDFWSLETPGTSGRGRKYGRVILDEASYVRELQDAWQGAIRPTLTDLKGDAWFLFTPHGTNFAHKLFLRGQSGDPGWMSWRRGTADNPHIDREEIEEARREAEAAGALESFEQEYLGIPADNAANPFGLQAIRNCIAEGLSPLAPVAWGWDLAKSEDWSVGIGLDEEGYVCRLLRFQRPWRETEEQIVAATLTVSACVDSTGVGDPILERLQVGRTNYEGFKFSSPSKQQLMEGLAVAIQRGEIGYPDGVLVHELESFEYHYAKTGVTYSAPSGLHDDAVCALALAVRKWREVKALGAVTVEAW